MCFKKDLVKLQSTMTSLIIAYAQSYSKTLDIENDTLAIAIPASSNNLR